jgi:hypothetical protein
LAKQYTKCCKPSDYSGWGGAVALTTIIGLAIALLTGAWVVLAPTAMADLVAFCEWWLYKRLVCLDGEKCVIGMLLTIEPPDKKSGFEQFDTDFSINLVLAPHTIYTDRATVENDGISGGLIKEQDATKNIGLGFVGYTSKQWANYPNTPVLHAEFEGGGIYDLMQAAKIVLALTAVGAVVCSIPVIGWVACAIIFIIAAIVAIVGVVIALNDEGSPSDANAELTELHTNDPTGTGADILLVRGTWIYDSFHDGWNELHPVLYAQKVGTWGGSWGFDAKIATDSWCNAVGEAGSPLTKGEQEKPENKWTIHPEVDGCDPGEEPEGPHIA